MIADAHVGPARAFVDGTPITIGFRAEAAGRAEIKVVDRGTGAVARRFVRSHVRAGQHVSLHWNGFIRPGLAARDGRYVVRFGSNTLGSLVLHGHFFPIRGPHRDRSSDSHGSGAFGTPRSGGRVHEGFDVNAACGTPVDAVRGGRVVTSRYDPVLYGNYVIVHSSAEHREYWYAHLLSDVRVHRGDHVRTGQRLGRVGATGNARTVGCHLHFELHSHHHPIDPAPSLHLWDTWS